MMRNDYRRSLILLRSNAQGYSGHVRLERRTLMGSMYFMLQAPEDGGRLSAALVGGAKNGYFGCPLGELRRDGRGQATLSYSFDPRDLCGRELEQYQLVCVTRSEDDDCAIVLFGNVNGHADVDWEAVRALLCEGTAGTPVAEELPPASEADGPDLEATPAEDMSDADVPTSEAQTQESSEAEAAGDADANPDGADTPDARPAEADESSAPMPEADLSAADTDAHAETAGERLGIDPELPWPEAIEPLRRLFMQSAPLENAPDNWHVFISAPMPQDCGYDSCAIGLRVQDGAPVSVCYALRAPYSPEPPAGLEDYLWQGDNNVGWWLNEQPVDAQGAQ